MKRYILEPKRQNPVVESCDVAVVGGGIAGVAAAVAAARHGAKVCLIEKENALGGLATLGNIVYYLPLCDGMGHQVIGGISEELLKLSIGDNPRAFPSCWKKNGNKKSRLKNRYRVVFNPAYFMLEMEHLVIKHKIKLWYDTRFCAVRKTGRNIKALLVENKSGRGAIECKTVVDASGDADVCAAAGEHTVALRTNVKSGWFYYYDGRKVRLNPLSEWYDESGRSVPGAKRGFAGDRAEDVTAQITGTRQLIRKTCRDLRNKLGPTSICPLLVPTLPNFRMTRRLKSSLELMESDERKYFNDTVGLTGDWRKSGPVYYLPLRSLLATQTDNLIVAGRCISAGPGAWDIVRAIPTCAVTGEISGTAAALAARKTGGCIARLNQANLQAALRHQGVIIDRRFSYNRPK
ncbi:MAG: FAD-dependent oxidoreductase [Kiritimatiellia bacterium]|nr:FAD-dependent oxidoreductase [Kiritimatiellia bacterium]